MSKGVPQNPGTHPGGYSDFNQGAPPYPQNPNAPFPQTDTPYPPTNAPFPPYNSVYQDAPSGPPPPYPANYSTGVSPAGVSVADYGGGQIPKDDDVENTPTIGFSGSNPFDDKAIRRAFIKKVYLILMAQLAVTVAIVAVFTLVGPVKQFVRTYSAVYYVSYAIFLVTYIALACCPGVRRSYPGNFIALAIFTLSFSYMTGTISSFYNVQFVLIAAAITCGICLAISLFATFTKIDFTLCTGLLFVLSIALFLFGISCIIVWQVQGSNYILQAVYGGLAALLFGLFLAFDTQLVLGGKRYQLSEEEYIFASMQLYLDVVYIFLMILSCFGSKS